MVRVDGRVIPLKGRQLLLALRLALAGRLPMGRQALLDTWTDELATDGALRVALTRLRVALGDDVIMRVDHGYLLDPIASVDADLFTDLVRRSSDSAESPGTKLALLDQALAMWRGEAYAGAGGVSWIDHEIVRLTELREQSVDRRFELWLADADDSKIATIVPELTAAADRNPEREHRSALAATALYRSGRQADALALLARTRSTLLEGYGLDPGQELRALEVAILRHELVDTRIALSEEHQGQITSRIHAATSLLAAGAHDALPIAQAAVELARHHGSREHLARSLVVTAQAMVLTGSGDPGPLLDEAQRIARTTSDGEVLARAALVKFGRGVAGDRSAALVELAEPLDILPASAPARVELLCASAAIISLTGSGPDAQRLIRAAQREHHEAGTARTEALWLSARAIVSAVDGHSPGEFLADAERSLVLAEASGDPVLLTIAYQAILRLAYATGDLSRVDSLMEPLEAASERALLPFGVVRRHLCEATNALARGELDTVPELILTTREVGRRLRTHAVDTATRSQETLLAFELDELERHGDLLDAVAEQTPHTSAIAVAALARPHDDRSHERLVSGIAHLPRDDSYAAVIALSALAAGDRRDAFLGQRCVDVLGPLGDLFLVVGFGSLALGPARLHTGVGYLATGDRERARMCLERSIELTVDSSAELWTAQAQMWLAEVMIECGGASDVASAMDLVDSILQSTRFRATWRIGRHATLLVNAVASGVSPAALRARYRQSTNIGAVPVTTLDAG